MTERICSKCGGNGPFPPRGKGQQCKACRAEAQRDWRKQAPEKARAIYQRSDVKRRGTPKRTVHPTGIAVSPTENIREYNRLYKQLRRKQQKNEISPVSENS